MLLVKNWHEKSITESQHRQNFDSTQAQFLICIHVATCTCTYTCVTRKMHSFSPNQTSIIFSCIFLEGIIWTKQMNSHKTEAMNWEIIAFDYITVGVEKKILCWAIYFQSHNNQLLALDTLMLGLKRAHLRKSSKKLQSPFSRKA